MKRDLIISSQLENINKVRYFLDQVFTEYGLDKNYFSNVFLGISEAVSNSIVHGNKLDKNKNVTIKIALVDNKLFIEIMDEGKGFRHDCLYDPTCMKNLKKDNGRGVFLINKLADDVKYSNGGRNVMIRYNLY